MLSFSAGMASSVRNPSSVCYLTPLLSKHLNIVLDTACLPTFTFAGKCAHLSSSRSCFFSSSVRPPTFSFTNTHKKCDHAHGIEAKHSHCASLHAQTTLLKLLQRENRETTVQPMSGSKAENLLHKPTSTSLQLSQPVHSISASSNSSHQDSPFNFFVFASHNSLTSSHLFSITFSGHMRKKHILTETSPPSWTLASVCKS